MLAVASVLISYAGVAALFAARPRSRRRGSRVRPGARLLLYALALAAVITAVLLWPREDGTVMASVCVVMAVSVAASLFVLLEPVVPRLVWGAAAVAPVVGAVLAALR